MELLTARLYQVSLSPIILRHDADQSREAEQFD